MNPQDSPIIKEFIYHVVKTVKSQQISHGPSYAIDTQLVPRVSDSIFRSKLLAEKEITPQHEFEQLTRPIPSPLKQIHKPAIQIQPPQIIPPPQQGLIQPAPKGFQITEDYGKITQLLRDPTVTYIECPGADKNLDLLRAGQKQPTRISLSASEIKQLLNKISEKSRVPLIEGVFRVALDNFVISAVVSDEISSRFIIKKQTPYSLLNPSGG